MADIFDDMFDDEIELQVVKRDIGTTQQMYFLDENGNHTRGSDRHGYFSLDTALEQVRNHFDFVDGNNYTIKYLTNDGKPWKSRVAFTYRDGMDLSNHVYSYDYAMQTYEGQGLDVDDIHVYGIVVQQLR